MKAKLNTEFNEYSFNFKEIKDLWESKKFDEIIEKGCKFRIFR